MDLVEQGRRRHRDRPHLRLAGLWWWHHGLAGKSFAAGTAAALLITGGTPWRLAEAAVLAALVLAAGVVATGIHVIAYYETVNDVEGGCPFCCACGDDGPDGGPGDDGPDTTPGGPDSGLSVDMPFPEDFAGFEALCAFVPAPREARR